MHRRVPGLTAVQLLGVSVFPFQSKKCTANVTAVNMPDANTRIVPIAWVTFCLGTRILSGAVPRRRPTPETEKNRIFLHEIGHDFLATPD